MSQKLNWDKLRYSGKQTQSMADDFMPNSMRAAKRKLRRKLRQKERRQAQSDNKK